MIEQAMKLAASLVMSERAYAAKYPYMKIARTNHSRNNPRTLNMIMERLLLAEQRGRHE